MQKIIEKVFFDDIPLIAQTYDKLVKALGRINFHNVPDNGHAADLYHRFRFQRCFFAQSCTQPAGKDYYLHSCFLFSSLVNANSCLNWSMSISISALRTVKSFSFVGLTPLPKK